MFNFDVFLAGYDLFTDSSMATTCRRKFKAASLQTIDTKNEGPFENMSFSKKPFEDFNDKKEISLIKQPRETNSP